MLIQGLICTNNPFSVAIVAGSCPSTHINPTSPGGPVQYVQCMPQYLSEFPPKLNGPNFGRLYSEGCLQDSFSWKLLQKALHQDKWQPWLLKQNEKLPEARDEAITCERQTQLMRFINRRSATQHYRGNGTTLQYRLTNEIWHGLSEYEIQQNVNTATVSGILCFSRLMHCCV